MKLAVFEKRYNLSTNDFIKKTPAHINELEAIEWSGEYETIKRLETELSRLAMIEICSQLNISAVSKILSLLSLR